MQNLAAKERAEGTQTEASLISSGYRNRAAYFPTALFSRPIFLNAKVKKKIIKKIKSTADCPVHDWMAGNRNPISKLTPAFLHGIH